MPQRASDGVICLALALSALAAVLTAPGSAGSARQKLQWLLTQDVVPEMTMLAGAVGDPAPFPVSP